MNVNYLKKFKYKKLSRISYKFLILNINKYLINDIGNIIRRIIISSIFGYKIEYFKIKKLKHQFCYINGILEDVLEISLNLKKIFFKLKVKKIKIKIIKKGPCYFTSKDFYIKNLCFIYNYIKICKINNNSIFIFYFKIIKGIGYLKISKKKSNKIYLNDFFSPILKVNYKKKKNNNLEFYIKTNGTINPKCVFFYSIKYLLKNFKYVL
ncbi:hypothetical protein [Candidatus Vidania fulgoroideorum]